ncbi:MAG: hypothetical protein U0835_23955 [Isosphaeraceae bacterium]
MASKSGFQIDRRVGIALDALSPTQKAAIRPLLLDRESFVAHATRPGATRKISASEPLYLLRAGGDMRIIYSVRDENIVVQDIMRKATMDHLAGKPGKKARVPRRARGEAAKSRKV